MLSRCWNLARTRACGIDPPRRPASASVATASATQMMERILQHQHLSRTAVTSGGRLYSYEHVCSSSDRISHAISTIVGKASKQAAPPRIGLYAVRHSLHWGSWDHSSCGHACVRHSPGTGPWCRIPGGHAGDMASWWHRRPPGYFPSPTGADLRPGGCWHIRCKYGQAWVFPILFSSGFRLCPRS